MNAALRTLAAAAAAFSLSACISLLPEAEPSQLYTLKAPVAVERLTPDGETFGLILPAVEFVRAAGGDRILTLDGSEAAYIAEARWLAPANVLFEEALSRAFDANPGPARLVARGEVRQADQMLRLDVRRFEAVYDRGARGAPTVVVRVRATLVSRRDRSLVGEQAFEAEVRAGDNRVGAIVAAFDEATGEVLTQLVDWANRTGGG